MLCHIGIVDVHPGPHAPYKRLFVDHFSALLDEKHQHLQSLRCEDDRLTVPQKLTLCGIEFEWSELIDRLAGDAHNRLPRKPTPFGAELDAESLTQVLAFPELQHFAT